jgi:hypothetical protein
MFYPLFKENDMRITKFCKTMKKAVNYQNGLYSNYNTVRLIQVPMFKEVGIYEWWVVK